MTYKELAEYILSLPIEIQEQQAYIVGKEVIRNIDELPDIQYKIFNVGSNKLVKGTVNIARYDEKGTPVLKKGHQIFDAHVYHFIPTEYSNEEFETDRFSNIITEL